MITATAAIEPLFRADWFVLGSTSPVGLRGCAALSWLLFTGSAAVALVHLRQVRTVRTCANGEGASS